MTDLLETIDDRRSARASFDWSKTVADALRERIVRDGIEPVTVMHVYPSVRAGDIRSIVDGTWVSKGLGLKRLLGIGEAIGLHFTLRRVQ